MLQTLIALTGNYCFFNLLTVSLCLLAVDDAVWPRFGRKPAVRPEVRNARWPSWFLGPLAVLVLALSGPLLSNAFFRTPIGRRYSAFRTAISSPSARSMVTGFES